MSYNKPHPVYQMDNNSCWAASTCWWLLASKGGRPNPLQEDIRDRFALDWDRNGRITLQGLFKIFKTPEYKMRARSGGEKEMKNLTSKLRDNPLLASQAFPIIVGYDDKKNGNHVVVLADFFTDPGETKFQTMDPDIGFIARTPDYFESATMAFAWDSGLPNFF